MLTSGSNSGCERGRSSVWAGSPSSLLFSPTSTENQWWFTDAM